MLFGLAPIFFCHWTLTNTFRSLPFSPMQMNARLADPPDNQSAEYRPRPGLRHAGAPMCFLEMNWYSSNFQGDPLLCSDGHLSLKSWRGFFESRLCLCKWWSWKHFVAWQNDILLKIFCNVYKAYKIFLQYLKKSRKMAIKHVLAIKYVFQRNCFESCGPTFPKVNN